MHDQTATLRPITHRLFTFATMVVMMAIASPGMVLANADDDLPQNLYFDVTINDDPMGYHHVEFSRDGDETVVDIDIDLRVKFAFITVFKYLHQNQERWQGDTLLTLTSETLDSGKNFFVNANREGEALQVEGSRGEFDVTGPIASTTYWNYDSMAANDRMLNSQKGDVLPYEMTKQATETIIARGQEIEADKYFLDAKIDTYIWYATETREWVKLEFDARGRTVAYTLVSNKSDATSSASLPPEEAE